MTGPTTRRCIMPFLVDARTRWDLPNIKQGKDQRRPKRTQHLEPICVATLDEYGRHTCHCFYWWSESQTPRTQLPLRSRSPIAERSVVPTFATDDPWFCRDAVALDYCASELISPPSTLHHTTTRQPRTSSNTRRESEHRKGRKDQRRSWCHGSGDEVGGKVAGTLP